MLLKPASSKQLTRLCAIESEVQLPHALAILEEAGIPFLTKRLASQMGMRYGILGMTTIYVEGRDLKRAMTIMNDATAITWEPEAEASGVDASGDKDPDNRSSESLTACSSEHHWSNHESIVNEDLDDLQPLRRERRYRAARLLTYAYSATLILASVPSLDLSLEHFLSLSALPCILISLAIWSRSQPEKGFGSLLISYAGLGALGMMVFPMSLLAPGFLVILSVYFAFKTATQTPNSPAGHD